MFRPAEKLSSLSIFFPFFNDAGTVEEAILWAYVVGRHVARELEVIAIHGGNSADDTWAQIKHMKRRFPDLKIIDQVNNQVGYAVIKHGFAAATKDWVFYTDGDLQYDVKELVKLVRTQKVSGCDVVNGYKIHRGDDWLRTYLGKGWSWFITRSKNLPIRDIDCDFRLIKRKFLARKKFKATGANILEELLEHLVQEKASFIEVPISHMARKYGHSNYVITQLIWEKLRSFGM